MKRPQLISSPQPVYPPLAQRNGIQGVVTIDAVIDEHGNIEHLRVVSGSPLLVPAALDAVAKWKYEPTYLNGVPIPVELTVDVTFHLR